MEYNHFIKMFLDFIKMFFDFFGIYELFERKRQGTVSLTVIEKLQSWRLIAKNNTFKCVHGHP